MVIKLEPDNPSNYSAKSRVLERLCRYDEAKLCYAKALKLKDRSSLGHDKNDGVCKRINNHQSFITLTSLFIDAFVSSSYSEKTLS